MILARPRSEVYLAGVDTAETPRRRYCSSNQCVSQKVWVFQVSRVVRIDDPQPGYLLTFIAVGQKGLGVLQFFDVITLLGLRSEVPVMEPEEKDEWQEVPDHARPRVVDNERIRGADRPFCEYNAFTDFFCVV